jgi:hypothetical protein
MAAWITHTPIRVMDYGSYGSWVYHAFMYPNEYHPDEYHLILPATYLTHHTQTHPMTPNG